MIKTVLSLMILVSAQASFAESRCTRAELAPIVENLIQPVRNLYSAERVQNIQFYTSIQANGSLELGAGNDDVVIRNPRNTSVDVFTFQTNSLATRKFYALITNSRSCEVLELKVLGDINVD